MIRRKVAESDASAAPETPGERIEERVVAFAGLLGTLVGTVQAKTEGWLDRAALAKEIGRIRDGAADLLAYVNGGNASRENADAESAAKTARPGRGPVDAPGRRHRKPLPRVKLNTHSGEARGKQAGRKTIKNRTRGRG